jgi:drug/metabolite transporter (DMT)-like permease
MDGRYSREETQPLFYATESLLLSDDRYNDEEAANELEARPLLNREKRDQNTVTLHAKQVMLFVSHSPSLLAFCSSLCYATIGLVVKVLTKKYSVFEVLLVRSVFLLSVVVSWLTWNKIPLMGPKEKIPLLMIRGIGGGVAMTCMFIALHLLPLSEAAFFSNSYSSITAVLSYLLGLESMNALSWLGVLGTIVGNCLVAQPPVVFKNQEDWDTDRVIGVLIAFSSALCVSVSYIAVNKIGKEVHAFVAVEYQVVVGLLICIPFLCASYPKQIKFPTSVDDILLFFVIALGGVLNQGLITRALQIGTPSRVSAVLMLNMIHAVILGVTLLH